ncbi:MAG: hypothetical protein AB7T38_05185 [Nitrospirales bacterium]
MSQIAALTAANAIAQLTLPLVQASVLPQKKGQTHSPVTPSTHITDTVSISAKAAALQKQKI